MGFSANWLALREPVDHVSRDAGLLARAVTYAGPGNVVVDLGSGAGSTARAFGDADCTFDDSHAKLMELSQARHPGAAQMVFDLRDIDRLPLEGVGLVTASALLDLMPLEWVTVLAQRLQTAGIPFYGALNYNGVMRWVPRHKADADVTDAFNAHQRTDKGIGPALGPTAGAVAAGDAAAEAGCTQAHAWTADRRATVDEAVGYIGHSDIFAVPREKGE